MNPSNPFAGQGGSFVRHPDGRIERTEEPTVDHPDGNCARDADGNKLSKTPETVDAGGSQGDTQVNNQE